MVGGERGGEEFLGHLFLSGLSPPFNLLQLLFGMALDREEESKAVVEVRERET